MVVVPFFNRQCVLEVHNGGNRKGTVYYGNSNVRHENGFVDARIEFVVSKTDKSDESLPFAEIKIYNLQNYTDKNDIKNQAIQEKAFVRLFAGYQQDFLNENMIPIFDGEIATVIDIPSYPSPFKILRCYGNTGINTRRIPSIALKGAVTTKVILASLSSKLSNLGIKINLDSLKNIYPDYSNKVISNRGYAPNSAMSVGNYLTQLMAAISSDGAKYKWFYDDIEKQIFFVEVFGAKVNYVYSNSFRFTLKKGVNSKLVDSSSVERLNRELYYQKVLERKQPEEELEYDPDFDQTGGSTPIKSSQLEPPVNHETTKKESVVFMTPIIQSLGVNTRFKFEGYNNLPTLPNKPNKVMWIGDTHSTDDKWRMEYTFTYERRIK